MISDDLSLGRRLRTVIEDLVENSGGSITGSVDKCDVLVCHYRDGAEYVEASQAKKDVGNLAWLYYLITHDTWTSPFRRLLHYPIARNGLPGLVGTKITVSNYGGEARLYLENLITAAGGEFTKSMKQDNTHLITARGVSEKCTAAREWNINMINHLWLEESYAKWVVQTPSNPRYTHFPPRTNLGEIVGQVQIDEVAVKSNFFPDRLQDFEMQDESDSENRDVPAETLRNTSANLASLETPTPHQTSKRKGRTDLTTPLRLQADKENSDPPSTTSRKAKERAVAYLHESIAPDMALYEKEKKRHSGGIWGGKRGASTTSDSELDIQKKRSFSDRDDDDEEDHMDLDDSLGVKKAKKNPSTNVKLLLTSYDRWVQAPQKEDMERVRPI
jgi:twin BRCT domain